MTSGLVHAFGQANLVADPAPSLTCGHDVQFYRSRDFLAKRVTDFLAAGVRAGQPLVVIATEPHRAAFAAGLRARGLDMDELFSDRDAVWLDARQTLEAFMHGRMPDRDLFRATVGAVFEQVLRKRHYLIVRGYGEMVDLLAKDGNIDGAIAVEALWNELADRYSYSLLCGYAVGNFFHESGAESVRHICAHHTRTLDLEQDLRADLA
jgi:hypothetical protein